MSFKKPSGLDKTRREFLDYPIDKGWRIRAYIEKPTGKEDDIVFTVEHESEKENIIRFDTSGHSLFHVDILGKQKPFKEFPLALSIEEKISCVVDFIEKDLKFIIRHNGFEIRLSKSRLSDIENQLRDSVTNPQLGKRTTTLSISVDAVIKKMDNANETK